MRLNRICLSVLLVGALAFSAQAAKKDKGAKKEHPKPVVGMVTAISVSGDSVSLTVKTDQGDQTLSMSSSVEAMAKKDGDTTTIMGLHVASANGKKEGEKKGKAEMISGTVSAASIDGDWVKLTITTADGAVQGQMHPKVAVMLGKDGQVMGLHAEGGMGKGNGEKAKGGHGKKGKDKPADKGGDENGGGDMQ